MSTPVTITAQTAPTGTCPQTFQEILNLVVAYMTAVVPGDYNSYVVSETTPAPEDQNKLWQKLSGTGNPERIYHFSSGDWLSLHNTPPGFIQLYMGDITNIDTFDGGSVGAVSDTTGPMWEVVSEAVGRTAVHPDPGGSVLPVEAPSVGDIGGVETVTLTVDQIPEHTHLGFVQLTTASGDRSGASSTAGNTGQSQDLQTSATGGGTAHNNMMPYLAAYYIRRTARLYYVG